MKKPLDEILKHISLISLRGRIYDLSSAGEKMNECVCRVFTRSSVVFKE